jgi:hypothetical protein
MAMSIRLDAATEALLERLARRRRTTKSTIMREFLVAYGREEAGSARTGSRPIDRVRHLIGCIEGPGDLSVNTGARYREILRVKHRARRSR